MQDERDTDSERTALDSSAFEEENGETETARVIWVFGAGAVHPGLYTTLTSYPLSWSITSLAFLVYYYRFSAMRKLNKLIEE